MINQQQAERLAAGHAELAFVDLAEKVALVELCGALQIAADFRPGDGE